MFMREASFHFKNAADNSIADYKTNSLEVIVNGRKTMLSVWNGYGKRVRINVLNKHGWLLEYAPAQSEEYIQYYRCTYMFQNHADLIEKVSELKSIYDAAGLKYDATSEEMEDRILQLDNPTEWPQKFSYAAEELAIVLEEAYHDYLINIEKDYDHNPVGSWSVYRELPILIQWLPGSYTEEDKPQFKEPVNVFNEEEFTTLNGGKSDAN